MSKTKLPPLDESHPFYAEAGREWTARVPKAREWDSFEVRLIEDRMQRERQLTAALEREKQSKKTYDINLATLKCNHEVAMLEWQQDIRDIHSKYAALQAAARDLVEEIDEDFDVSEGCLSSLRGLLEGK